MASCKGCGAPVRIGQTCRYCGRIAEPGEFPELRPKNIPEVNSVADFYMAVNRICAKYVGEFDTPATRAALQDELNNLVYFTPSRFVPREFKVNREPGIAEIEAFCDFEASPRRAWND